MATDVLERSVSTRKLKWQFPLNFRLVNLAILTLWVMLTNRQVWSLCQLQVHEFCKMVISSTSKMHAGSEKPKVKSPVQILRFVPPSLLLSSIVDLLLFKCSYPAIGDLTSQKLALKEFPVLT